MVRSFRGVNPLQTELLPTMVIARGDRKWLTDKTLIVRARPGLVGQPETIGRPGMKATDVCWLSGFQTKVISLDS